MRFRQHWFPECLPFLFELISILSALVFGCMPSNCHWNPLTKVRSMENPIVSRIVCRWFKVNITLGTVSRRCRKSSKVKTTWWVFLDSWEPASRTKAPPTTQFPTASYATSSCQRSRLFPCPCTESWNHPPGCVIAHSSLLLPWILYRFDRLCRHCTCSS